MSNENTTEQDVNYSPRNHYEEIDKEGDASQESNLRESTTQVSVAFLGDPLSNTKPCVDEVMTNKPETTPSILNRLAVDNELESKIEKFNQRVREKKPSKERIELQNTLNFLKTFGADPDENCPQFIGDNTYQVSSVKETIDNLTMQPGYILVTATPQISLLEDDSSIVKTTSQHDPTALVLKALHAAKPGQILLLKTQALGVPFNLQYKDEEGNAKTLYCHIVRADDILAIFRHDNTQALTQPSSPDA